MTINPDTKKVLLVDADYFIFRASSSVQKDIDWGGGLWTCHADAEEAIGTFIQMIDGDVILKFWSQYDYEVVMCLSDPDDNFRKHINPEYKSNRKNSRKPCCYNGVVEWVKENYHCVSKKSLEADDVIGILATTPSDEERDIIIVSPDKDFYTIPDTYFYRVTTGEITYNTKEDAEYAHMFQTLTGDLTDGYRGCPGYGKVNAHKILKKAREDKKDLWETVLKAYLKVGLTEEDALLNARMAFILTADFYDFKAEKPILWVPKK